MRLFTLITLLFFSQFSYSQIQESDTYFIEVGDIRALFSENINLVPKIGYAFSESIATFVTVNRQSEARESIWPLTLMFILLFGLPLAKLLDQSFEKYTGS